jgi:hypothetical protein
VTTAVSTFQISNSFLKFRQANSLAQDISIDRYPSEAWATNTKTCQSPEIFFDPSHLRWGTEKSLAQAPTRDALVQLGQAEAVRLVARQDRLPISGASDLNH